MKRAPSKEEIRQQIARQVSDYLGEGNKIERLDAAATGLPRGEAPQGFCFDQPRQSRTPVPEVVAAIEARRRRRPTALKPPTPPARQQKLIYDDFGEPLRWVWIDAD